MREIKTYIRLLLSIALIVLLIVKVDISETITLFRSVTWEWLLLIVLFRAAGVFLNVFRWRLLLACHAAQVEFWELLKARFVGLFYNNVLPSSSGGDMVRAYFLSKREAIPMSESFSTVVIEKVSGVIALVGFLLIAFGLNSSLIHDAGVVSVIIITTVFAGISITLLFNANLFELTTSYANKKSSVLLSKIATYYAAIHHFTKYKRVIYISVLYSVLVQATSIGVTYAAAQSLHIPLGITDVLLVVPLVGLSNVVPVSLGNWGWREGVYVFILQFFSIQSSLALALALLMRVVGFFMSIFGAVIVLSKQGRFRLRKKV